MDEQSFDATRLIAKAAQVQEEARSAKRAEFEHDLERVKAQAPNGGAYVADGSAPPMQGA